MKLGKKVAIWGKNTSMTAATINAPRNGDIPLNIVSMGTSLATPLRFAFIPWNPSITTPLAFKFRQFYLPNMMIIKVPSFVNQFYKFLEPKGRGNLNPSEKTANFDSGTSIIIK